MSESLTEYRDGARPIFLFFKEGARAPTSPAASATPSFPSLPVAFHRLAAHHRGMRITRRPTACLPGEQLEVVQGVNPPHIEKIIADQIPEGLVDTVEEEEEANAEEEED